ncbi:MAG: hypothetical protein F7B61_00855 [Caldisphaeraceae archaeon]|nr:hypothetical protein [Caldisphaeraceae archaeon]
MKGSDLLVVAAPRIFVLYVTNAQSDYRLFSVVHDIPANAIAYSKAISLLNQGKLQPSYLNGIMKGILQQAQYGQKFPNIPQMSYYWKSFHTYASEFFASKITAT